MKKKQRSASTRFAIKFFLVFNVALIINGASYANLLSAQQILDKIVSVNAVNTEVSKIIARVQKQSGVKFIFSSNLIDANRKVTCHIKTKTLGYFIQEVLNPLAIGYSIINDHIVLFAVNNAAINADVQYDLPLKIVTGSIKNDKGEPLSGASINVKNTKKFTTSNSNGDFSIEVNDDKSVLLISYTGYDTKEIAVGSNASIAVVLNQNNSAMNEVVVVGYGTQKRRSVTGAISTVSGQDIAAMPVSDARQALQGRAAGVSVVNNGAPGDAPIINIRGIGSINFSSSPLFVIDGFIGADMGMIDGRDIQSVDILRDAASTAIYGSRGANGVIQITTKKASKSDRAKVTMDSYYGYQKAWKQLDLLNTEEYIKYATALKQNAGTALPARFSNLDAPVYAGASQTYRQTNTDWQNEMFRSAPITQNNISVSSGNERSRFYTSAGYTKQDGIMLGTQYERFNFRLNSDHTIGKIFTVGESFTVVNEAKLNENNSGGRTQIKHIIHNVPYIPVKDPTLLGGYRGPSGDDGSDPQNPVRIALQDLSRNNNVRILGMGYIEASILKGLTYRFSAGVDFGSFLNRLNNPIYNESFNARGLNRVEQRQSYYRGIYLTNQITYNKSIGKHTFVLTAVGEKQDGRNRFVSGGSSYTNNEIREVTNFGQDPGVNGGLSESEIQSYIGRLTYDYNDRYLLTASYRRDGSSVWAPGNKWANFPSVSAGWRISNEPFFNVPEISELKLRGSWGKMGNNGLPNYSWQSILQQISSPILGDAMQQAAYVNKLANKDLAWEITDMTNFGFDLGLWNNKLTFQAEYYKRKSNNLILDLRAAPSLGFTLPTPTNIASMENSGIEFQATYSKRKGSFNYNISGNVSLVNNKVIDLGPSGPLYAGNLADFGGQDITRTSVGNTVQSFFGWKVDGIFQSQAEIDTYNGKDGNPATKYQSNASPGDIRFKDIDGNGVINADDRTVLGSFIPDFSYGINFTATYKNFDATMFIQGIQGNKVYNGTKVLSQGMLRLFGADKEVLNAWTPQNTNTNIPRAVDGDPNNNTRTSDRFLEDGSYLRIKVLSIGYNLPLASLAKIANGSIGNARIYLSSQNLLTLTKYSGYDPEIGSRYNAALTSGIDYGQFPQARTILLGIQVGFK